MDHASNTDTHATGHRPTPTTTSNARDHVNPDGDNSRPFDRSTYISVPYQVTFAAQSSRLEVWTWVTKQLRASAVPTRRRNQRMPTQ